MRKKSSISTRTFIFCLALISLFNTSCTSKVKSPNPPKTNEKKTNQNSKPPVQVKRDNHSKEKLADTPEEFDASNLPLISAIPDRNIYLYGIKPNGGVVLYIDGKGSYFNWAYLTPRFILPVMNVGDYDNDGNDELAIVLYVGSGTGYAVEELHIIELSEKEFISEDLTSKDYYVPNPKYFKDHFYQPDNYLNQLNRLVKLKTYYKNGELMATIRVEKQLYTISLKHLQSISDNITVKGVDFSSIVYFQAKDKKLTGKFALGLMTDAFATPDFIGEIQADVNYNAGKFTISNLRFEQNKE